MNPCAKTGKPVRLGAYKTRINRKHGIVHYIAYLDGGKPEGDWTAYMEKPYPPEGSRPFDEMIASWNAVNPTQKDRRFD